MTTKAKCEEFDSALQNGNAAIIFELIKNDVIDLNSHDVAHDLTTPLMRLCHLDNISESELDPILEAAGEKGIDLDRQDGFGRTLAVHACIAGKVSVLEFLAPFQYKTTVCDKQRKHVFHYAALSGIKSLVVLLLQQSNAIEALHTLDCQGFSPIDHSKQFPEIQKLLTSFLKDHKQKQSSNSRTIKSLQNQESTSNSLINQDELSKNNAIKPKNEGNQTPQRVQNFGLLQLQKRRLLEKKKQEELEKNELEEGAQVIEEIAVKDCQEQLLLNNYSEDEQEEGDDENEDDLGVEESDNDGSCSAEEGFENKEKANELYNKNQIKVGEYEREKYNHVKIKGDNKQNKVKTSHEKNETKKFLKQNMQSFDKQTVNSPIETDKSHYLTFDPDLLRKENNWMHKRKNTLQNNILDKNTDSLETEQLGPISTPRPTDKSKNIDANVLEVDGSHTKLKYANNRSGKPSWPMEEKILNSVMQQKSKLENKQDRPNKNDILYTSINSTSFDEESDKNLKPLRNPKRNRLTFPQSYVTSKTIVKEEESKLQAENFQTLQTALGGKVQIKRNPVSRGPKNETLLSKRKINNENYQRNVHGDENTLLNKSRQNSLNKSIELKEFEEEVSLNDILSRNPDSKSKKHKNYQRNESFENTENENEKTGFQRLQNRRSSISLPDLREISSFLVSSQNSTPRQTRKSVRFSNDVDYSHDSDGVDGNDDDDDDDDDDKAQMDENSNDSIEDIDDDNAWFNAIHGKGQEKTLPSISTKKNRL